MANVEQATLRGISPEATRVRIASVADMSLEQVVAFRQARAADQQR